MQDLTIDRVLAPTGDLRALIEELEAVLSAEYPPEQRHALALDALFEPHIRFFVASLGGEAVGCGGIALFDGFAEVKRMYVRPAVRGRGVAQAILARLEAETRAAGLDLLRLETGDKQRDALRLYRRWGFADCPVFGVYLTKPAHTLVTSLFLEKRVA